MLCFRQQGQVATCPYIVLETYQVLFEREYNITGWLNVLGEQTVMEVIPNNLILHATNRKPKILFEAVSDYIAGIIVAHVPIQGVVGFDL